MISSLNNIFQREEKERKGRRGKGGKGVPAFGYGVVEGRGRRGGIHNYKDHSSTIAEFNGKMELHLPLHFFPLPFLFVPSPSFSFYLNTQTKCKHMGFV